MEIIDTFLHIHPHPLKFFEVRPVQHCYLWCEGCYERVSELSSCYECLYCDFALHKSCAEANLPREIQNFFHPCPLILDILFSYTCNACFEGGSGFVYRCKGCRFDMHVECAQRKPTVKSDSEEELIQHFTHWHPLQLLVDPSSNHLDDLCNICNNNLCSASGSGSSAYGCQEEGCNFFVHKSCIISIPRQINNHSFHPSCPLILLTTPLDKCSACDTTVSGLIFRCGKCKFQLDAKCALMIDLIQHSSHKHPLVLHEWKGFDCEVQCSACGEYCFLDPCYGCSNSLCNFILHKKCADELQPEIHHPSHSLHPLTLLRKDQIIFYYCEVCGKYGDDSSYGCKKCDFYLHFKCALTVDAIQLFSHNHLLVLHHRKEFDRDVRCSACGEYCLFDPFYVCSKRCDLFLHKKCADELQAEIHHPFHSLHPLTLLSGLSYRCKVCDEDGSGLAYCCKKCKFHLDLKCAVFPTIHQSKDVDEILHCGHKHPLVALHEIKEFGNEVRCRACAKSCSAPWFGCTECNFFLHKTCAAKVKEKDIRHHFHPLHSLTLSSTPPLPDRATFRCDACLGSDDVFILRYRCADCDFDLHIDCVQHQDTVPDIKYEGHKHHLTYFDKTFAPAECSICQKNAQTCFFRCLACKFNVHIYCIPSIPKTIIHKRHLHPLTVTESPFEYELISSEYADDLDDHEFYCDVCEEKRYKFESVYYCADCKFIAEVRCVLSELEPSLKNMVEGTVGSREEESSAIEATIKDLKSKIAKSKKVGRKLNNKVNFHRGKLKRYEEKLDQEKCKFRELKTDHFLYKYQYGYSKKGNESSTDASSSFSTSSSFSSNQSTESSSESSA